MTSRARLFLFTAVALLLAVAFVAPRLSSRYQLRVQAQAAAVTRWEQQIQHAREQRDALVRRLDDARRQTATAAEPSPTPDLAQMTEIGRWVRQVKQLKQIFAQRPDQKIPELALLGDQDWLSLARRVQLDTDDNRRRALAIVRNEAKGSFALSMRFALETYVKANHGQLPADTAELQPYLFDPTSDPADLAQYEMLRSGQLSAAPDGPVIKEKSVVDEDYDHRMNISRTADSSLHHGFESKRDPAAPIDDRDLNEQIEQDVNIAVGAFVAKNRGALPRNPGELLPYFDPPLGPAMTEMINRPLTPESQKKFEEDIAKRAAKHR
jgi:hypothetical protein